MCICFSALKCIFYLQSIWRINLKYTLTYYKLVCKDMKGVLFEPLSSSFATIDSKICPIELISLNIVSVVSHGFKMTAYRISFAVFSSAL